MKLFLDIPKEFEDYYPKCGQTVPEVIVYNHQQINLTNYGLFQCLLGKSVMTIQKPIKYISEPRDNIIFIPVWKNEFTDFIITKNEENNVFTEFYSRLLIVIDLILLVIGLVFITSYFFINNPLLYTSSSIIWSYAYFIKYISKRNKNYIVPVGAQLYIIKAMRGNGIKIENGIEKG